MNPDAILNAFVNILGEVFPKKDIFKQEPMTREELTAVRLRFEALYQAEMEASKERQK